MGVPDEDRSVGRYRVLRRIGSGGMSVVYRAYDPSLDRHVALKILPPWEDDSAFARLEREARAMAQLAHPHVAAIYETGRHGRRSFIAMELIEGPTLSDWVDETARPWTEVMRAYLQAGRGLAAAHRAGLVHRDFKPSNVLIGDDGRVRVVDFGLARPTVLGDALDETILPPDSHAELLLSDAGEELRQDLIGGRDVTRTGVISGTPAYMSPELHAGGLATPASDQFAFAVALWEGLYGERPFPGRSAFAVAQAICNGERRTAPNGFTPKWVEHILHRALQPDPVDRYPSMGAMLGAFVFTWRVIHA